MASESEYEVAPREPTSVVSRGDFTVRSFTRSVGVHKSQAWCEVELAGEPAPVPGGRAEACSLSASEPPMAATLVLRNASAFGLYHLAWDGENAVVTQLAQTPRFDGAWTTGDTYLRPHEIVAPDGNRKPIPEWSGRFLSLAPDRQAVLTAYTLDPQRVELRLWDLRPSEVERWTVQRPSYPWLTDDTAQVPGSIGSSHVAKHEHIQWETVERGWRVIVDGHRLR